MKPGEKIKKLRTEKMMTQSELAGSFITRNMLSLIESGSAQASLATIIYLAERLNVPPGILISDDNDEYFYRRVSAIENIRKAYFDRDFKICIDLCNTLGDNSSDSEILLLKAECMLELAKEEFFLGRLKNAIEWFDEASESAKKTIYNTGHIFAQAFAYCDYMMNNISQSLYSDCAASAIQPGLSDADPFCRYAKVLNMLKLEKYDRVNEYIRNNEENRIYTMHIKAKLCMIGKDSIEAKHILTDILNSRESVSSPVMYDVFKDLEECCRDTGDFKGAYEYSSAKVAMLERMISDETFM